MNRQNSIIRLLGALPAQVADEKKQFILADVRAIDMEQHFRQSVMKPSFDVSRTNLHVVAILKKHLGISSEFFTDPATANEEIRQIVEQSVSQVLS